MIRHHGSTIANQFIDLNEIYYECRATEGNPHLLFVVYHQW